MKRLLLLLTLGLATMCPAQKPINDPENAKRFWELLGLSVPLDAEDKENITDVIGAETPAGATAKAAAAEAAAAADATAKVSALEGTLGTAAYVDSADIVPTPAAIADKIGDFTEANRLEALAGLLIHKADTNGAAILPKTSKRIQNTAQNTSDPFRLIHLFTGDSFAVDLGNELIRTTGQSIAADGMGYVGLTDYVREGSVTVSTTDWTRSPHGNTALLDGASDALIYPATQNDSYKVQVFYSKSEGVAGVFKLQSSTNGGAWTDIPGGGAIDVEGGVGTGITAGVFEYSFTTTDRRRYRALRVSGTVKIIGMTRSNIWTGSTEKGGIAVYNLSYSGQKVSESNLCPQAVWTTVIGALQPDIVTFKADDDAVDIAALESVIGKCTTAYSGSDWVLYSQHPTGTKQGKGLQPEDIELKRIADDGGHLWINGRSIMPDYAVMQSLGMLNGDNYHLNAIFGSRYLERRTITLFGRLAGFSSNEAGAVSTNYSTTAATVTRTLTQGRGTNGLGDTIFSEMVYPSGSRLGYQLNFGNGNRGRISWGEQGRAFITGGANGWGFSTPPGYPTREPRAQLEIQMDDTTARPALELGAGGSHRHDLLTFSNSGSNGTQGTTTGGVTARGQAHFKTVRPDVVTVSQLSSLIVGGLSPNFGLGLMVGRRYQIESAGTTTWTSIGAADNNVGTYFTATGTAGGTGTMREDPRGMTVFVSDSSVVHAGNSGNVVAGGGANLVPVYFDGTDWRIH